MKKLVCFYRSVEDEVLDKDQILMEKEAEVRRCTLSLHSVDWFLKFDPDWH